MLGELTYSLHMQRGSGYAYENTFVLHVLFFEFHSPRALGDGGLELTAKLCRGSSLVCLALVTGNPSS